MNDKALATRESLPVDVQRKEPPSVGMMLQGVIDKGVTADNVAAIEKLVGLYERMEAKKAEVEFAGALAGLQAETVRVVATKKVDVKADGSCRYKFAPYEEIMATVQPLLTKHGFSVTFDTQSEDQRLTSICTLTHKAGYSRSNRFAVRYGKPPGSSDAQGDMSTKSYAKRGALCDCLNISIEHDDDAKIEGAPISSEQAFDLERRVALLNQDHTKFLKWLQSPSYAEIPTAKYAMADDFLAKKEKTQ